MQNAITEVKKEKGLLTSLVVCMIREDNHKYNNNISKTTIQLFEKGMIQGVDLAGNETKYPNQKYQDLFKKLHESNVPITIHAGEAAGPESIKTAIEKLHATRIGHGTSLLLSPEITQLVRDKNIFIESSITSNYQTGAVKSITEHPVKKLLKMGIKTSLCSDDPVTTGSHLANEYSILDKEMKLTEKIFKQMQLNAINASFIQNPQDKLYLKNKIIKYFERKTV